MNEAAMRTSHRAQQLRERSFVALAYLVVGALITYAFFRYYAWYWGDYDEFNHSIEFCEVQYCDFVLFYWEQSKFIATAHAPITKYFYSPTFALWLWPLGKLPLLEAVDAWTWVQAVSLFAYVVGGIAMLRRLPWWSHLALLVLALTSFPILHNWKWGQANTLFIALSVISLALPARAPSGLAALPVAMATASRYFPGLFVFPFLVQRRWGVLAWFAALTFSFLVLFPVIAMGPSVAFDFYRNSFKASTEATSTWVLIASGSQYLPGVLARAFHVEHPFGRSLLVTASYALTALNLYVASRWLVRGGDDAMAWAFCFIASCTTLLLPTSWMHYLAYLPVTQAFLLFASVRARAPVWTRALAVLLLWVPCVGLSNIFFFNQFRHHEDYSGGSFMCVANLLMLALAHGLSLRAQRVALSSAPSA